MRISLKHLLLVFLLLLPVYLTAEELTVTDKQGNDINVRVYPSDKDLLIIWLVDHAEERKMFEDMLRAVNASGAEIWRVDLLESYFLPRSSENERTLPGEGVAAVLRAAHKLRHKDILLVAYDRMPLSLLRGARQWQRESAISRVAGAVLFYPNLFGPAPIAGEDPVIDPIVEATNIPVWIYQPDTGSQRWRLQQVMEAFWKAGSPAMAYLVPETRDWFFMGDIDHGPGAEEQTRAIPGQLQAITKLMQAYPKPRQVVEQSRELQLDMQVTELVRFRKEQYAPGFSLTEINGEQIDWERYQGKVTLVNFWATWCPPCVEEVPSLNSLAARYQNKGFEVVSIDYRETREALLQFIQDIPVDFPVLLDNDGKVSMQWKVFSFPSSFLLDKSGRIRYSANRAIDWDTPEIWAVIEQLLAE